MARTIVITGAGAGLGRALARRFAADGETVVLLGRTLAKVQQVAEELGAPALAVECDVASPDSVCAAFAEIAQSFPTIDVLINSAAIYEPFLIADASDAQILDPILTNFAGPIFCVRSAIPMMANDGHIINVTSESVTLNFPMLSLYQSTKAALERFGQSLVGELTEAGIRVTTVRAGQMADDDKQANTWPPEAAMAFFQSCLKAGIDLRSRPISHVNSVTDAFRAVIDLPADVHLPVVVIEARHR